MTGQVFDNSDRMLVTVLARAIAFHDGRKEPTLADKRLAARLLTQPGSPLQHIEPKLLTESNGNLGLDVQALIG
jgi:hypothetical protein